MLEPATGWGESHFQLSIGELGRDPGPSRPPPASLGVCCPAAIEVGHLLDARRGIASEALRASDAISSHTRTRTGKHPSSTQCAGVYRAILGSNIVLSSVRNRPSDRVRFM